MNIYSLTVINLIVIIFHFPNVNKHDYRLFKKGIFLIFYISNFLINLCEIVQNFVKILSKNKYVMSFIT